MECRARHLDEIEFAFSEFVAELDPDAVALCEAPRVSDQLAHMERLAASARCGRSRCLGAGDNRPSPCLRRT
jgi:hypothetical protein